MARQKPDKKLLWKQGNLDIPVHIFREWRASSRVSIGKKAILIRVPQFCRGSLLENELLWIQEWLQDQFIKKPSLAERYVSQSVSYQSGDTIHLFNKTYEVVVIPSDLKNAKGHIQDDRLFLKLPQGIDNSKVPFLISRIFAKLYLPHFEKKVSNTNLAYFNKDINSVRLKYNRSNWGSCSNSGNINLSTRLLFAPEAVQDYVVIHELAHLVEMNHSERFWELVSDVMPSYKEKETWLKTHGNKCFF